MHLHYKNKTNNVVINNLRIIYFTPLKTNRIPVQTIFDVVDGTKNEYISAINISHDAKYIFAITHNDTHQQVCMTSSLYSVMWGFNNKFCCIMIKLTTWIKLLFFVVITEFIWLKKLKRYTNFVKFDVYSVILTMQPH